MTRSPLPCPRALRMCPRRGFTLVEAAISSLLVGLVFVGALRCVGAAVSGRSGNAERVQAALLAQHLMSEILTQPYKESGSSTLGPDSWEVSWWRMTFDDIDDYDGYSESPPENLSGVDVLNGTGWSWQADVDWVELNDPSAASASDQGVKRVTIQVSHDGVVIVRTSALKCDI